MNEMSNPPMSMPEKGGSIFSSSHDKKGGLMQQNIADEVNNLGRRLKVLEERYTNLRRKTQMTDQSFLNHTKKVMSEIKLLNSEMDELRQKLDNIDNKMLLIMRELRLCAKKEEIAVLQKYINLWEPVHFVTRNEVIKILEDLLQGKKSEREKELSDMFK
jgi:hypothetical protein